MFQSNSSHSLVFISLNASRNEPNAPSNSQSIVKRRKEWCRYLFPSVYVPCGEFSLPPWAAGGK